MTTPVGSADDGATGDADVDVAVVGFGPVGAVLAALLGRAGVRVAVVDRATEPNELPRATYFDREIMRVFQAAGYADEVRALVTSNRRYTFFSAAGEVLTGFDHLEGPTPWGMPTGFNFYQPEFEPILRAGAGRCPTVDLHLGTALEGLDAGDAHATLRLSGGQRLRAAWVVGCDGGASTVRRQAGITLEDLRFDEPWIVLDALVRRDLALPRYEVIQRCDPARPSTYIPSAGRHRRWEFMLLPGEDPEERVSPRGVAELLATWGVAHGDVDVVRSAVFRFHALLARPWRRGRVLLAGDAAHQMPPFFGQGMCSGIRDAANLAWKLARVVAGTSDSALLDTYEQERSPHVRSLIDLSIELGGVVCTTDPAIAAERDARMRAEAEHAEGQARPDPLEFIPGLATGVLHVPSGGAPDPRAGQQFIQPRVQPPSGSAALLDEIVGSGFRLLCLDEDPRGVLDPLVAAWWNQTGTTAVVVDAGAPALRAHEAAVAIDSDGFVREWLRAAGADAVLVRPDHYVFGVSAGAANRNALVADLRRQLGPRGGAPVRPVATESQRRVIA